MYGQLSQRELLAGVNCPCSLLKHNDDVGPAQLIKVSNGVYMAFGYGLANSVVLEGAEGLVIVDTLDTVEGGEKVLKAIREVTQKPIKAIVYTHHHTDHVGGTEAFIEDKNNKPDIWGHELFQDEVMTLATITELAKVRGIHQFGPILDKDALVNAGIGSRVDCMDEGKHSGLIWPTKIMQGQEQKLTLAGLDLVLIHIPGETNDQIGVWWPERKVFVCGDDVYKAFPNLYAIRGTVSRSVLDWVNSLNKMLQLDIEHLVPCHTRPVSGRAQVTDIITAYRDAIKFVHDETVRHMNAGMHPEDIAHTVQLPEHLAKHPYLIEYYGTVKWSVKAIFTSYVGWFSGDPVELLPLTPQQRAVRMLEAIGGADKVLQLAQQALDSGDHQWALELASHVMLVDQSSSRALGVRTEAMKQLAGQQVSANGRHWYLTHVLKDHGLFLKADAIGAQVASFEKPQ